MGTAILTTVLNGISGLFGRLPLSAALALGRGLGWVYGSLIRYHRRDAFDALARSFPGLSSREARGIVGRMYANLGMNVAEFLRLRRVSESFIRAHVRWENEERLRDAMGQGRGVLALTAHVGNFDLLCTVAPLFGLPLTAITKDIRSWAVNEWVKTTRRRFGLRRAPAHHSYRQCLSALRCGEVVGFILDQNMIRTEGIFVDFLGRPACTTPGLAYLSAQSGAPVVPVFIIRQPGGRHVARVLPPIEPPPDRDPDTIRHFTQRYSRVVEEVVREYPDQWIWIHRRWKTAPVPEAALDAQPAPCA